MQILLSLQKFDRRLFHGVFRQTEKRLVIPMARAISRSGDGYLHITVPLLIWVLDPDGLSTFLLFLGPALTCERTVYWIMKNSLRRPRPKDTVPEFRSLIDASDQFSFPSGHSSGAFLLATCLMLTYGSVAAPMFLWAISVAVSRVLLGVHFPGDTLAGALLGCTIALAVAGQLWML